MTAVRIDIEITDVHKVLSRLGICVSDTYRDMAEHVLDLELRLTAEVVESAND